MTACVYLTSGIRPPLDADGADDPRRQLSWRRTLIGGNALDLLVMPTHLVKTRCEICRHPTHDEFCDPFFWEAGHRVCEPCGKPYRPGPRPHRARAKPGEFLGDSEGRFL